MPSSPFNHDSAEDPKDPNVRGEGGAHEGRQDVSGSDGPQSVLIPEGFLPEVPVLERGEGPSEGPAGTEEGTAIARGQVVALWLQQMERQSAPFSLEGLVVAAMNSGYRQARAADCLSGPSSVLSRLEAPSQLDILVARNVLDVDPSTLDRATLDRAPLDRATLNRAPVELDGLVEGRVIEPEAGLVRGMTKRLDAIQAPRELQARVELQVESGLYPKPVRRRQWLRVASVGVALAAGVLLISRLGELAPADGSVVAPTPEVTAQLASEQLASEQLASVQLASVQLASGDMSKTASGLTFKTTFIDSESMSKSDRNMIQAMGLPAMGGS